jgi:CheY-like chemotaxis protein
MDAPAVRWRILLIDDSQLSLDMAAGVLAGAGFDVRTTDSVGQVGAVLSGWSPDVILTDVHMPGMSGVELCDALKQRYETAEIPIVLFSDLAEGELERLARECAADGYVSKRRGFDALPDELRLLCESLVW